MPAGVDTSAPAAGACQAPTSLITSSVTELMKSGLTSVPYRLAMNAWNSRTVIPRAYMATLVVKPREAPLVLGDEQRLEAAGSVSWDLDTDRAVVSEHGLTGTAVAVVGALLGTGIARVVSQVMGQLGAQRPLDQRLLEGHRDVLNGLGTHRARDELVNEIPGDGWQSRCWAVPFCTQVRVC